MKNNIKKLLRAKNISQTDCARAIGISTSYVSRIINNERGVNIETFVRLRRFLQCAPSDIFPDLFTKEDDAVFGHCPLCDIRSNWKNHTLDNGADK